MGGILLWSKMQRLCQLQNIWFLESCSFRYLTQSSLFSPVRQESFCDSGFAKQSLSLQFFLIELH